MTIENKKFSGILLDENDKPIEGTEFISWYSRSIAVVCLIMSRTREGMLQFLLEKRGPGCPDFVGCYCAPCGYLGWNETLRQAAVREVYEETGLKIKEEDLKLIGINDDPSENRQNVTVKFLIEFPEKELLSVIDNVDLQTNTRGGEFEEVEELSLVPYFFIKDRAEEFAFGHDKLIKEAVKNFSF